MLRVESYHIIFFKRIFWSVSVGVVIVVFVKGNVCVRSGARFGFGLRVSEQR